MFEPRGLDVPFWLSRKLIQQNGDPVDRATALEMCLYLLGGSRVVNIANKDAATVDILLIFCELLVLLVQARLHLPKLGRLLLHLRYASLHGRNLFLRGILLACRLLAIISLGTYLIIASLLPSGSLRLPLVLRLCLLLWRLHCYVCGGKVGMSIEWVVRENIAASQISRQPNVTVVVQVGMRRG